MRTALWHVSKAIHLLIGVKREPFILCARDYLKAKKKEFFRIG